MGREKRKQITANTNIIRDSEEGKQNYGAEMSS